MIARLDDHWLYIIWYNCSGINSKSILCCVTSYTSLIKLSLLRECYLPAGQQISLHSFPSYVAGFPCGSAGKESTCNAEDLGSIPGLGRSSAEETDYPLQYSGLENSMDCIVHGIPKSPTQMSDFSLWYLAQCQAQNRL